MEKRHISIEKETTKFETTISISKMQMDLLIQMPQTRNNATNLHHSTSHTNTRSERRNKETQHDDDEDDKERRKEETIPSDKDHQRDSIANYKHRVLHSMNVRTHCWFAHQVTCHSKDLVSIYSKSLFFRSSYTRNHCESLLQEMRQKGRECFDYILTPTSLHVRCWLQRTFKNKNFFGWYNFLQIF